MELDSLKSVWQDAATEPKASLQEGEIQEMLGKSSKSPVSRMMRNVLIEMLLIIVLFGAVAIYYFVHFEGRFSLIAWTYLILAALCTFYYWRKWKLLQTMQCTACHVKSNLQRQVTILEKYIRLYFLSGTVTVPLVFIFLGLLFYFKFPEGVLRPIFPPVKDITSNTWLAWGLSLVGLTTFAWFGNRWYVNRLYGRHILKLKELLKQMEE